MCGDVHCQLGLRIQSKSDEPEPRLSREKGCPSLPPKQPTVLLLYFVIYRDPTELEVHPPYNTVVVRSKGGRGGEVPLSERKALLAL